MGKKEMCTQIPTMEEISAERERLRYSGRYRSVLRSTIYTLVVVAAIAVLVATLWLPFLRLYGTSMAPTLEDGQIVCCVKTADFKTGDILAFYYNNKILVKRVIGLPGDWINIDEQGNVYRNSILLNEPYVNEKSLGECDITFPYQVPDGRLFVMGDHRSTSVDSRHTSVGCVPQERIVGRIILRLWPLNVIGPVE